MRRSIATILAAGLAIGACSSPAAAPPAVTQSAATQSAVTQNADTASALSAAIPSGPTDPNQLIRFEVALRLPGRAGLDAYLKAIADPSSPDYRGHLTAQAFAARFGLPDSAIDSVKAWLTSAHLDVVGQDLGRTYLGVSGRAADVENLLGIQLVDLVDPVAGRYHVPEGDPRIAASVADSVAGIAGLDTTPRIRPMFVPPLTADVPDGGMTPTDAAIAYDIAPLHDAGFHGEGQTIAVVSFDSFLASDVAAFDQQVGITSKPVERRPVPDGYKPVVGDGTDEVNLDIDIVRAIAPAATIIDYETDPNESFATALSAILDDGRANIVTNSWGGCEIDWPKAERDLIDTQLDRAVAQGISIFAASGDSGAFSCAHQRDVNDDRLSALYPSVSPDVISVGGTFLWVREDGTYLREAAWEESLGNAGTGGGPSKDYPRPTWQVAAGLDPSGDFRETPDVAGPADADSGLIFAHTPKGDTEPVFEPTSGTSAATPFWAASMLLVQQLAAQQGLGPLPSLGPLLYQIAASPTSPPAFHDVTLAGNLHDSAGPGWDAATGLGSPDVTALAAAIVESLQAGK